MTARTIEVGAAPDGAIVPGYEFICELEARLEAPLTIGQTPVGLRRMVPITGGRFEGPRLRGTGVPGGADWQYQRADGAWILEAIYLLRTDDGVLIQVRNHGLRDGPPEVMRRLAAGEAVDPSEYYFRACPSFEAPAGRYEWLNRGLFVCTGARYPAAVKLWVWKIT
ncbi:MAG: DUF3237 domain-containing protein [Steroidobacteraceae bacterium]